MASANGDPYDERTGDRDDWHRRHARLESRRPTRTVREDASRDDWADRHARTRGPI